MGVKARMVAECSGTAAAGLEIPFDDNFSVKRDDKVVGAAENLHRFTLQEAGKGKFIQGGRERQRCGKGDCRLTAEGYGDGHRLVRQSP